MLINIEWVKRGGKGEQRGGEFSLLEIFKMLLSQSIALIMPLPPPLPQPTAPNNVLRHSKKQKREELKPLTLVTKKREGRSPPL